MQHLKYSFWLTAGVLLFQSCVSSKVYRAEVSMREQCETREKVLVKEQLERRKETAELVKQVGDLNRLIGNQEAAMRDLQTELAARTQEMGASSSKLVTEKSSLEKELAGTKAQLDKCNTTLDGVSTSQKGRKKILAELKTALSRIYPDNPPEATESFLLLTLPDNNLFDKTGQTVSPDGRNQLAPLARFLTEHPELDVEVRAYTDNALPKGVKNLDDTWEWSLMRASNVVRTLIREFNVNANQLTPVGKGEFYPLASNETPEGRLKNRRTVLAIFPNLPKVPQVD